MHTNIILLGLLSTLVDARPREPSSHPTMGIEGYGIEDFTWEMPSSPDGSTVTVKGTVQDAVAKLNEVNPNWKADFNFTDPDTAAKIESRSDVSDLETRASFGSPLCNIRTHEWGYAGVPAIIQGIKYLKGVPGKPTNGPGPGNCGRVSCSEGSAIYWCNDVSAVTLLPI